MQTLAHSNGKDGKLHAMHFTTDTQIDAVASDFNNAVYCPIKLVSWLNITCM